MATENFTPISIADDLAAREYQTAIQGNNGNVGILQFPLDLGVTGDTAAPQQSHYTIIYINEVKAGAYGKDTTLDHSKDTPVFMEEGSTSTAKLFRGIMTDPNKKANLASTISTAAATGVGVVGGGLAGGWKGGTVGALTGAAAGAYAANELVTDEQKAQIRDITQKGLNSLYELANAEVKRTMATVVLPMPDQLSVSYDPNWAVDDSDFFGNVVGLADKALSKEGLGAGTIAKAMMVKIGGSSLQNVTNKAVNPRTQMLFQGMNFRNFPLTWTLYPRNKDEASALWLIVEFLKYHALPEYDEQSGGVFLIQPSLFDIEFHSYGQRNDYLPKTLTCYCKNVSVDYVPAGNLAFFEPYVDPYTGRTVSAPIGIRLSLSFEENEILTKNRINPSADGKYTFNQGSGSTKGTF